MVYIKRIQSGLSSLFKHTSHHPLIQFFRYFIAGGTAFIVDFLTLVLLTEFFNISYLYSAAIAFLLGLFTIYILTIVWVFQAEKNGYREIVIFLFTGLTGLLLNELILFVSTDYLEIHYSISKLISAGIVFFWNFFSRKILLSFGEKKSE
jgi:putative flippase GtrA